MCVWLGINLHLKCFPGFQKTSQMWVPVTTRFSWSPPTRYQGPCVVPNTPLPPVSFLMAYPPSLLLALRPLSSSFNSSVVSTLFLTSEPLLRCPLCLQHLSPFSQNVFFVKSFLSPDPSRVEHTFPYGPLNFVPQILWLSSHWLLPPRMSLLNRLSLKVAEDRSFPEEVS